MWAHDVDVALSVVNALSAEAQGVAIAAEAGRPAPGPGWSEKWLRDLVQIHEIDLGSHDQGRMVAAEGLGVVLA